MSERREGGKIDRLWHKIERVNDPELVDELKEGFLDLLVDGDLTLHNDDDGDFDDE